MALLQYRIGSETGMLNSDNLQEVVGDWPAEKVKIRVVKEEKLCVFTF